MTVGGWVDPTGRKDYLNIGRTGRECEVVYFSSQQNRVDDKAAHKELVKATKAEHKATLAEYKRLEKEYKKALKDQTRLEKEFGPMCSSVKERLDAVVANEAQAYFVDPPKVILPAAP